MAGTLFVVATPIGNLEDITLRALRTLRDVDLIACEDTRHTRKLLAHYQISTPTSSYHEHNEQQRTGWLVERLESGMDIALVSDAGTPSIADPGYRLVRASLEHGLCVSPIPGACAIISALSVSGRPTDSFAFLGFLPGRRTARRTRLRALRSEPRTLLFFESPLRLASTLSDIDEILDSRVGNRRPGDDQDSRATGHGNGGRAGFPVPPPAPQRERLWWWWRRHWRRRALPSQSAIGNWIFVSKDWWTRVFPRRMPSRDWPRSWRLQSGSFTFA